MFIQPGFGKLLSRQILSFHEVPLIADVTFTFQHNSGLHIAIIVRTHIIALALQANSLVHCLPCRFLGYSLIRNDEQAWEGRLQEKVSSSSECRLC